MNPTASNTQRPTGATEPLPEIPRQPPYLLILKRRVNDLKAVVGTAGFISLRPLSEGRSSSPLVTGLTALQIEIQEACNNRDLEGSVI